MQDTIQLADSVEKGFQYYVGYGIVVGLPFIITGLIMAFIYYHTNRRFDKSEDDEK